MIPIVESHDYEKLSTFFHANGLEVTPGISMPTRTLKCWECVDGESGALIAAAALEMRGGVFVVADIAVGARYRGLGLGIRLMHLMEEEVMRRGGKEAWLAAKVPAFYEKLGWVAVEREDAPDIADCLRCPQFGNGCEPRVMRKSIKVN